MSRWTPGTAIVDVASASIWAHGSRWCLEMKEFFLETPQISRCDNFSMMGNMQEGSGVIGRIYWTKYEQMQSLIWRHIHVGVASALIWALTAAVGGLTRRNCLSRFAWHIDGILSTIKVEDIGGCNLNWSAADITWANALLGQHIGVVSVSGSLLQLVAWREVILPWALGSILMAWFTSSDSQ